MSIGSHYQNLRVSRSASSSEIDAAHRLILSQNHPDKVQQLGPFARSLAAQRVHLANAAWEVLSNPTKRRHYNMELAHESEQQESWRRQRYAGSTPHKPKATSQGMDDSTASSESETPPEDIHIDEEDGEADNEADDPHCITEYLRAEYRYGNTPIATDVDVTISGWRIRLRISSKFRFLNDLTELSDPRDDSQMVGFEIGLQRAREVHSNLENVIPELTIDVEIIPSKLRVSGLQALLRELTPGSCSLVVMITANRSVWHEMPWTFGLDFDMNHLVKGSLKRGTCTIFSIDEPAEHLQAGQGLDTPECVLKWDKALKANRFHHLGAARVGICDYGGVEMWRLSAVGYRVGF
ncbi:DnaJ DnaJ-class molecular chaperone with C-terminal Zn finger domain [Pyrenophora tritici-repentis]|nr:DnaJ DnaJ-class molecular chaperone with C-terminal Zn finger domain [Pyrenophora tritici-repentis]KAI1602180.1 DnaJ DnaJ-class molecular chaperone with C-terminal Zn finger domain [Pyrenophora tritici-repentis]